MDVKTGRNVQPARLNRESGCQSGRRARRQNPPPRQQVARRPIPDKPFPNPLAICQRGPDGWTLLLNPDIASAVAVNRTGALIWKLANGKRTVADIVAGVRRRFPDAPGSVADDVASLLTKLSEAGLIGEELTNDQGLMTKSS